MDYLLPIGSIVKTNKSDIQFIIIGHDYTDKGTRYNYVATIHPVGFEYILPKKLQNIFFFDKKDIEEIYFIGYVDDEIKEQMRITNCDIRKYEREKKNG